MTERPVPRYPISAPIAVGIDNLNRLGLTAESSMSDDVDDVGDFSEVLISVHAPVMLGDLRLNLGATDAEFRERSIQEIIGYIDKARRYPNVRQVNVHPPPRQWLSETQTQGRQGDYDLMIEAIRQIAEYVNSSAIEIVLENNNASWSGVGDDVAADDVDWENRNQAFGVSPEEWIQICEDVARPNVALCLDSSHACTYAHTFSEPELRHEVVMAFLAKPNLIHHVHWNDNYLYDSRGRQDSHALLGKGTMPVELHRTIKGLDATLLIEHFYTIEELEEELEYIERL